MDPAPVADDKLTANLSSLMHNRYFLLALIFTVVSIVYWTLYAVNAYNHFIYASDFGYYLYNMYYDIHYPNIMGGLQLLVFGQHIAPDQLAVLLIYSIFQSPLTLPIVQLIALSLTGLLVFWVTKDLLKNDKLALILCTAYLLNPGMHGALIFDYHAEFLIIPFFIATFYFYMKASFRYFFVSLLLLLGTIESSYAVAFALGLGLLLYEMMHNIDAHSKQTRIKFAYMIIIGSIGALLFYNTIYFALPTEQVSVSHGILPIFAVSTYPLVPIVGGTASPGNEGLILSRGGVSLSTIPYVIYALIVVFFGFGIALFFDPISAIIFSVPWLVVLFVFKNIGFALVSQQYFTFVVAGAFAATILGFKLYENNSSPLTKYIPALKTMVQRQDFGNILAYSTLGLAVIIYLLSFLFLNLPNVQTQILFSVNSTQSNDYAQLNSIISKIPSSGNLSVEPVIMPHVANRPYMEQLEDFYFLPDFIVVDLNDNITSPYITNKMEGYAGKLLTITQYDLVARNGTAFLIERNYSAPVRLPGGVS